jgi:hypothetical protein
VNCRGTQRKVKTLCALCVLYGLKITKIIYFNNHARHRQQGSEAKSKVGRELFKITANARRTEVDAKCFTAKGAKSAKIV